MDRKLKKMEARIKAKLLELRVYIPFMDYYISLGRDVEDKFSRMKQWILENKRYNMDVLEKFEKSINCQYQKLLSDDVKVPSNFSELFSQRGVYRVETIDLCSDGEGGEGGAEVPVAIQIENKNEVVVHKHELSDGEIIDSDSENAPKRSKKPCSFQIGTEKKNDCDNLVADLETDSPKKIKQKGDCRKSNSYDEIASTSFAAKQTCSNSTNLSKDKGGTVSKSTTMEKKNAQSDNFDADTEELLQRIDKIISLSEEKNDSDIECMSISDKSDKDSSFELPCIKLQAANIKVDNESIGNEEQLFTRRSNIKYETQISPKKSEESLIKPNTKDFDEVCTFKEFQSSDKKNDLKVEQLIEQIDLTVKSKKHRKHHKKSKKRRKRSTELPPDSSSDEDNVPAPNDKKLSKSTAATVTCVIALSDTDEPCEKTGSDNIIKAPNDKDMKSHDEKLVCDVKKSVCDDENLDKLDLDELYDIFSNIVKGSNLEQFIKEFAQAGNDNKDAPKPIQSISTEYENLKPNSDPHIPIHANPSRNYGCDANNLITIHPQTAQPLPLQTIQQPPLQNNKPQTSTFTAYPIINFNGRKINLNDPRLRQHMEKLLNSPILAPTPQIAANAAYFSNLTAAPKPAPIYPPAHAEPSTYGEYKRLKERKKIEAAELRKKAALEQEKKNLNVEVLASPLENSKVVEETEAPEEITKKVRKTSESSKSKTLECVNSIENAPGPSNNAKPVEHRRASDAAKSYSLDMHETQPDNSNISNSNDKPKTSENAAKILSRRKSTMRVLKELECTVIGFDKLKDYLPQSFSGKRKSSESARSAIAKQLNSQQSESTQENSDQEKRSQAKLPKRRSSMCLTLEQNSLHSATPAPIAKRRRTCIEADQARLSLLNSDTDSADEESSVFPRKDYAAMPLSPPKDTSSSDTDTFDFSSFRDKKAKALALKNQPYVLLQRLTEAEIKRHTYRKPHIQPEQMCLNVELVQASTRAPPPTQTVTASRLKASKNVPNIDKSMTERNTTTCALCKAKPANLVNHYIKSHKTEAYVSRLTDKELEELQLNCPFAVLCTNSSANTRYSRYKVQCVFCADELVDNFINFYTHYSTHTGEYGFQCFNCDLKKPFRADIQSHQHHAKACRNARIQKQYVYPSDLMVIYLHCCKLCNFVQLNEANVFKHLRDQHAKYGDDATLVQKYIAAAINDAEIVNEVLHSEEQGKETLCEEEELMTGLNDSSTEIKPDILSQSFDLKHTPSFIDVAPAGLHMTVIPMTNLSTTHATSFLDQKSTATTDCINDDELPRPIVVKMEVKLEENVTSYAPHIEYRYNTGNSACFGLFKCMGADCYFSTDADSDMLQHLRDHSLSDCPPSSYHECSYCQFQFGEGDSAESLVAHIKQQHCCSRFQCPICCYRSCVPGNVAIHCKTIHDSESGETLVYECLGKEPSHNERLPDLLKSMSENVKKLQCHLCPQGFYATNSLNVHLQQVHAVRDVECLEEYACIYCAWNSVQKTGMQNHVALSHPDELAYACRRDLKDSKMDDSIDSLMLWNITEFVQPTAICKAPAATIVEQSNIGSNSCDESLSIAIDNKTNANCEPLEQLEDLKPTSAQLEYLAEESLRALLNKLTSKTGLPPDRLYHCPIATCGGFFSTHALWSRHMTLRHNCLLTRCPHCADQKELMLSDFEEHFQQHCRHLYVCYHCSETFGCKQTAIAHFQQCHSDEPSCRFELVKFNFIYSYHIIISTSVMCERIEVLQALQANVSNRLEQLINQEKATLQSKWLVPLHASWLEDYPLSNRFTTKTCIVSGCVFKTRIIEQLFQHWESTHTVTGEFKCSRCPFQIKSLESWQPIMDHVRMHDSTYVCCVCNFNHFGRQQLSAHIQLEHNSRDVPFLSLLHSSSSTYMRAGVVFAANCKTFSTIHTCFYCNAKNLSVETLTKHFKKVHHVLLQHYCELCNAPIEQLSDVDAHHSSAHAGCQMKVRFEFMSHDHLQVKSTTPLIIDILSDREVQAASNKTLAPTASDSIKQEDTVNVVGSLDQINIKREILDDGNESDVSVEIIEDDDLVRAAEFSARRNEQNKTTTEAQKIRCISMKNLFDTNTATSLPSVQPITTINELAATVTQTQSSCQQNIPTLPNSKVVLIPTTIAEIPIITTAAKKATTAPVIKTTATRIVKAGGRIPNTILFSKLQQGQQYPPQNIQQGGTIETVQYSPQGNQGPRVSAQVQNPTQHYEQRNAASSLSSSIDPVNQPHKLLPKAITVTRIPTQGKAVHNSLKDSRNVLTTAKPSTQVNIVRPINTQTPLQQIVKAAAVPQVNITPSQINEQQSQQAFPSSTYISYQNTPNSTNSFQQSFSNGLPQQSFANAHPQQAFTNFLSQQSYTNVYNQQTFSNVVPQQNNLAKALPQQTINTVPQHTVINTLPQPFPQFSNVPLQRQQTFVQPETTSNTTAAKTYIIFN